MPPTEEKTMTRKDFVMIAKMIGMLTRGNISRTEKRATWINAQLKETNPNFDKDRFWDAVEKYSKEYYQ